MAGRQVNGGTIKFDTKFNSDISGLQQAKSALEDIQKKSFLELKIVDYSSAKGVEEATKKLDAAKESASQLSSMLDAAFNKDLGKLNISAFEQQLKQSSTSLQQMYANLSAIGPVGQDAFHKVATEVLTTNTQLQKSKTFLDEMAETMSNTVKWGIASSVMKNFTTSVQQAYSYVKNLDYSLNQIRIVSGQSADQMDKFAVKANASAKALGAATRQYTDASLIYFQQGLGMEEATQRTDVTIKMSNALGESASKVSDYMTAIWNNFDDGSQSLEYFGDVLAKLGASTASSAEEIAEGLDKFAAVANTVGLSYEYATTALATVVAETRQSADVVGTAFKTLFARIQDLELGKTLDDDTTLGTYSQALDAVGINIKQQNGELKDMDDILNEMGTKWKTLGKDQQVALAQTVAGVRQYTQLIALMDNWDTFNQNLKTAQTSAGTLEEQQSIYMESVDAHVQQLRTSWEELYSAIGDTKTINGVLDTLTGAVNLLDNFVDSIGGGSGALLFLGSVGLKVFDKQLSGGIARLIKNFNGAKDAAKELEAQAEVFNKFKMIDDGSEAYKNLISMVEQRIEYQDLISDKELEDINNIIKAKAEQDRLLKSIEDTAKAAEKFNEISIEGANLSTKAGVRTERDRLLGQITAASQASPGARREEDRESILDAVNEVGGRLEAGTLGSIVGDDAAREAMQRFWEAYGDQGNATQKLASIRSALGENSEEFQNLTALIDKARESLSQFVQNDSIEQNITKVQDYQYAWDDVVEAVQQLENNIGDATTIVNESSEAAIKNLSNIQGQVKDIATSSGQKLEADFGVLINEKQIQRGVQAVSDLTSGIMSLSMGIQAIQNLGSIWDNEDLSFGDKFLQTIMSVSMGLSGIVSSVRTLKASVPTLISSIKDINISSKTFQYGKETKTGAEVLVKAPKTEESFSKYTEIYKKNQDKVADLDKEYKKAQAQRDQAASKIKVETAKQDSKVLEKEIKQREKDIRGLQTRQAPEVRKEYGEKISYPRAERKATQELEGFRQEKKNIDDYLEAEEKAKKAEKELNDLRQKTKEITDQEVLSGLKKIKTKETEEIVLGQVNAIQMAENLTDEEKIVLQKAVINGNWKEVDSLTALKAAEEGVITKKQLENTENLTKDINNFGKTFWKNFKSSAKTKGENILSILKEMLVAAKAGGVAVLALAAGWAVLSTTMNKLHEEEVAGQKELAEERIKNAEAQQEQIDKNKEGAQSYADLYKQLENGSITQAEFDAGKLDLISSMGEEVNTLDQLIKRYGDYNTALQEYNKTQNEAAKKTAEEKLSGEEELANAQTQQGKDWSIGTTLKKAWNFIYSGYDRAADIAFSDNPELMDKITKDIVRVESGGNAANTYTAKEMAQMTATQRQKLGLDENYEAVQQAALEVDKTTLQDLLGQEGMDLIGAKTQDEADKAYNTFMEEVNRRAEAGEFETADIQNILDTAKDLASQTGNQYATQAAYNVSQRAIDRSNVISQAGGTGSQSLAWKINWSDEAEQYSERLDNILDIIQNNPKYKIMMDEGLLDWNELIEIKDPEELKNTLNNQANSVADDIVEAFGRDYGEKIYNAVSSITEKSLGEGLSFSDISDNGNLANAYKTIMDQKDSLTQLFPELENAMDVISNKALAGTKEFSTAMFAVQSASQQMTLDSYNKQLTVATKKLNSCKKGSDDWKEASENVKTINEKIAKIVEESATANKKNFSNIANGLGDIKDNYQSITTVAQDYNSDGKLTIDNLETILTMNDDYLECLEMQNGQLTINRSKVQNLIQARLDEAKATAYNTLQTDLSNIANGTAAEQTYTTAGAVGILTTAMKKGTDAAMEGGSAFVEWTKSMAEGANVAMSDERVQAAFSRYQTRIKAIGNFESQMKDNLDAALKGGTDSQADKKEYEVDKYEKINRIIEKLTRNIQKLQDAQGKLVGADLLSNLNQQTEVLKEQNKAYEKKLELQKEEAASLRSQLSGWGATFDQDGNINYNAFMVGITNAANAGSISDDQYERYKDAADKYKQVWESDIHDVEDSIQETASKLAEIELEKLNVKVNMQLDTSDATRQYNEWYNKVVQKATRAFGSITNVLTGELAKKNVQTYMDDTVAWINKFTETKSLYDRLAQGDTSVDQSKLLDDLKEASQGLMSAMENIEDEYKNVMDAYLSSIDTWSDALDKINSDYESINSQLNHAVSLTKLLFGDNSYSAQNQYLSKVIANSQQQLTFAQQQVAKFQEKMNQALAKNDDELYEKYKEKYTSWLSSMNSILESTLQSIQTKYTNSLSQIFADFEKKILGASLDRSNEEWDRLKTSAGLYLDKVNRAYEITKLQAKYTKQLNSTSNIDIQNKINKAMQAQIKALQAKTKLSKYDVDLANAKYETLVAEIALQEAQANKTKMQLQRDSQGNYSYVYSQDENAIADAQSKLEEARVNEWNIIKEKNDSIVSDFSTQMKNFEDALKKAYTDNKDDPQTRETEIKKIISEFKPIFGGLGSQWSTARDDMAEWIASDEGISVTSVTDDMIKGYYPNWNNNMVDMLTKLGNSNSFEEMANQIAKEANEKTAEYQTQVNEILNTAKTSLADIKNGIYGDGGDSELSSIKAKDERIAKAAETNTNKLEALKNTVAEKYNDFMDKYGNLAKGYLKQSQEWLKKINDATQKYQKSIDSNVSSIKSAMSDVTNAIENSRVTEQDIRKAVSGAISSYTGGKNDVGKDKTSTDLSSSSTRPEGMSDAAWRNTSAGMQETESTIISDPSHLKQGDSYYFSGLKLFSSGGKIVPMADKLTYIDTVDNNGEKVRWYYGRDNKSFFYNRGGIFFKHDNPPFEISKKYRDFYSSYDTGGYTGDWSGSTGEYKNGRWSLLHPKELVLNKDDTKNFLTAIEGVRSMSDIISMLDSYSKARYSMITDNIKSPNINTTNTDNSSAVTQNIAINADFSGLHDAQELESAIDNLSNKALQYAYKTI